MTLARAILLTMTIAASTLSAGASVTKAGFGADKNGTPVDIYTLTSGKVEARIMTLGARIVSLKVPDRNGNVADVVLGYDTVAEYQKDGNSYFGAIVGRYGNRIAKGKFSLDGHDYQVPTNNNGNSLHGGLIGFDSLVWTGKQVPDGVEMTLVSKDGDQGYPGTLTAHVTYTLKGSALKIDYSMSTDKDTVVNLTNHSYFNLSGEGNGTILDDLLTIPAARYTPVDSGLIPTGIESVAGTPLDFRKPTPIGARINDPNDQLKIAGGYDHNWVLSDTPGVLKEAAKVEDPKTGRVLTVMTTEPGVQFYTGNFLTGKQPGKGGASYPKNAALCLETQHFPDSPNHPAFPSTELKPGHPRHSTTIFSFSTEK
ncbi:aldose epimerase family protein [Granulicella sibirica]|uniref:Aldose 1-epimerase n=1 Tax=Granulicella sibirica TaxID=2479048 RepID=A0A4Q0T032_9BACT|nr:aldose epimerase family protein [Granulicella sibirica]RXH54851.1 Aldose 1-epimerase [Granulicella sibirica]